MIDKEKLEAAYLVLQDNCGIEVGDTVKVLRSAKEDKMGWSTNWYPRMDASIGGILKVSRIVNTVGIQLENGWAYPFFVLEKVASAPGLIDELNKEKTNGTT